MAIRWSGNNDKVKKTRIQHFTCIAKSGCLRGMLQCCFDTLWIGVTHSQKFETDCVLDCLVVLMSNCTVCEETDTNRAFFHD